jgi:hypothetical protein
MILHRLPSCNQDEMQGIPLRGSLSEIEKGALVG